MPTNGDYEGYFYAIGDVPIFTYGMITATIAVLAYMTAMEPKEEESLIQPLPSESPLDLISTTQDDRGELTSLGQEPTNEDQSEMSSVGQEPTNEGQSEMSSETQSEGSEPPPSSQNTGGKTTKDKTTKDKTTTSKRKKLKKQEKTRKNK